jgi:hypothetical protein
MIHRRRKRTLIPMSRGKRGYPRGYRSGCELGGGTFFIFTETLYSQGSQRGQGLDPSSHILPGLQRLPRLVRPVRSHRAQRFSGSAWFGAFATFTNPDSYASILAALSRLVLADGIDTRKWVGTKMVCLRMAFAARTILLEYGN